MHSEKIILKPASSNRSLSLKGWISSFIGIKSDSENPFFEWQLLFHSSDSWFWRQIAQEHIMSCVLIQYFFPALTWAWWIPLTTVSKEIHLEVWAWCEKVSVTAKKILNCKKRLHFFRFHDFMFYIKFNYYRFKNTVITHLVTTLWFTGIFSWSDWYSLLFF